MPSSYHMHFTIAAAEANHYSVSHQYERDPPWINGSTWISHRNCCTVNTCYIIGRSIKYYSFGIKHICLSAF